MGQFSVEIPVLPGSDLSGNQQADQSVIDRCIAEALLDFKPKSAMLNNMDSGSHQLLLLFPIIGDTRDALENVALIGAVLDPHFTPKVPELDTSLLTAAFGMTQREAQVSMLVARGLSPQEISKTMGITLGTTRNYIKVALAKSGARSQSALASIVMRLT